MLKVLFWSVQTAVDSWWCPCTTIRPEVQGTALSEWERGSTFCQSKCAVTQWRLILITAWSGWLSDDISCVTVRESGGKSVHQPQEMRATSPAITPPKCTTGELNSHTLKIASFYWFRVCVQYIMTSHTRSGGLWSVFQWHRRYSSRGGDVSFSFCRVGSAAYSVIWLSVWGRSRTVPTMTLNTHSSHDALTLPTTFPSALSLICVCVCVFVQVAVCGSQQTEIRGTADAPS